MPSKSKSNRPRLWRGSVGGMAPRRQLGGAFGLMARHGAQEERAASAAQEVKERTEDGKSKEESPDNQKRALSQDSRRSTPRRAATSESRAGSPSRANLLKRSSSNALRDDSRRNKRPPQDEEDLDSPPPGSKRMRSHGMTLRSAAEHGTGGQGARGQELDARGRYSRAATCTVQDGRADKEHNV